MENNEIYKHHRINPITGEEEWYFPMELNKGESEESRRANEEFVKADRAYAREHGLDVGWSRLGFREFEAMMIPCKWVAYDKKGNTIYLDTPPEEQRRIYLEYIKDEMNAQAVKKLEGRCAIPDGKGGIKRCHPRINNPDYKPGNGQKKTIAVSCEGCIYEPYKNSNTTIVMSELDHYDEYGNEESYDPVAPYSCDQAWLYEKLRADFICFVEGHSGKNSPELASLLTLEYDRSEAARELNAARSTIYDHADKLGELFTEFSNNIIIP